jgi:hypothetical protein
VVATGLGQASWQVNPGPFNLTNGIVRSSEATVLLGEKQLLGIERLTRALEGVD